LKVLGQNEPAEKIQGDFIWPKSEIEMKRIVLFIALIAPELFIFAQDEIWIHPNRGQWHENVSYEIRVPGGFMFLEKNGFTYDLSNVSEIYDHAHNHSNDQHDLKGHVVKSTFVGANERPVFEENDQADFYENYFLGNDSTRWKSSIYPCRTVNYLELYDGISLSFYEEESSLKYDILISAGTDPSMFQVSYEGQDGLYINAEGELVIQTTLGTITEGKPLVYQTINGLKKEVECNYVLEDNLMYFEFPESYDTSLNMVIDPSLAFSTFTGASSDNWGMSACPDVNKNLIAGGIVFGSSYPLSTGAYDPTFNSGLIDIGLTKFNSDGTSIIFSTFLGGAGSETPHSLIVNDNNELYVLGATSSTNFPTSATGFQLVHDGGPSVIANGLSFTGGTDIFITRFNPTGTGILGSTYYGGSSTDGMSTAGSSIAFNYGDQFRGEIMVDAASNVYISSTTQSGNIEINGGFQSLLSGTQDAIVAKFNSNLSSLLWSTYLGGAGLESGNSVQLSSTGDIFVAGGTTSSNFPNVGGQLNGAFQGGSTDGYVTKFPFPAYNNPKSTYVGTDDYDQAYFVQLDPDDFVYLYGQTKGNFPISAGVYGNANSGQFIQKISNDLTTNQWTSTFGAGSGNEELSPTAFLVSDCYEIYIAGWGGLVNTSNSAAVNSSSNGMPLTSDAYQSQTSGNNFYLALFTADMNSLKYATYMGSVNGSNDHVDGGTSRFDKQGGAYHAVCAACGGNNNGFPTTPGVFSETNNSSNCNLAAFLFELSKIEATLSAANPVVCYPDPVDFINDSQNGNLYLWDFGDGTTSNTFEPTHNYQNPGDYTVMLIVSDASGCYAPDTAYLQVSVQLIQAQAGTLQDTICPGTSVQLFALGGDTYSWGPPNLLDDPNSANPIAIIYDETTFTVTVTSACGDSEVEVIVSVYGANADVSPDTAICIGESAAIWASGGGTYSWTPAGSLDNPAISNPIATPSITTNYIVDITTPEGCLIKDTTQVWVDQDLPFPVLADEVTICKGASTTINITGGTSYLWSPNYNINDITSATPIVYPEVDTTYYVDAINACGITPDSIRVIVIEVQGTVNPDTTICPGRSAILWATGGVSYNWSPSANLAGSTSASTVATPPVNTQYMVIITDGFGCRDTQFTNVFLYPTPSIEVSPAVYAVVQDTIQLWAQGNGTITWGPNYNISCLICTDPFVWPEIEYVYTATITDANGCTNTGTVPIYFDPLIYVPNAFTPNGDSFNQYFKAEGLNILEFKMLIFNRWGELIKTLNNLEESWDGTYQGVQVKDDVYIWQIRYIDLKEDPHTLRGHVTVLK
jgi:gliding motility-associated-like protein